MQDYWINPGLSTASSVSLQLLRLGKLQQVLRDRLQKLPEAAKKKKNAIFS